MSHNVPARAATELSLQEQRLEVAARVAKLDTPTLRVELAKALAVTAESLTYLAAIWRELEDRGEDLSDLRRGMGQYLPMIAAGQLAAETVVRFAGRLSLLRAVQTLPVDQQRALALGEPVKVAVLAQDDRLVAKDLAAVDLTSDQIRLVFDRGRIRPVAEQENMISSARLAARRRQKPARQYRVRVDGKAGRLHVGRMTVDVREVLDALRLASLLDDEAFRRARALVAGDGLGAGAG